MTIAENLKRIRERMQAAAARAGRDPSDIRLMAVSKTFPASAIAEAYGAGMRLFGENRVQEFATKGEEAHKLSGASFHLIGHLQSNKATKAVELFDAVDSVDSFKLAAKLNSAAQQVNKTIDVLLEVNIGGEEAKSGLPADLNAAEWKHLLQEAPQLANLHIRGLMCIPPHTDDANGARPYFKRMRDLREQIVAQNVPRVEMTTLSIGMSHDFEVAIEEGSTCVRLGTAIFGERPKP